MDRLIDVLWDDYPPVNAVKQVRNAVSMIRRALTGTDSSTAITADGPGYRLTVADDNLDALIFERHVALADTLVAAEKPGPAVEELRSALDLWRGPALTGLTGQAIVIGAANLNERRLAVLERCVELELALGRHHQVVGELTVLVAEHPLRERLVAQLMLALHRSDRQAEALTVFHQLKTRLANELGIDPSPELAHVHERLLRTDQTKIARAAEPRTARPEPPPTSNGRPGNAPDQVRAMVAPVVHPMPPRPVTRQLPAPPVRFAGRDRELGVLNGALANHVRQTSTMLTITISGPGGIGKTWLALYWAHLHADRFPDGHLHVNLAGFGPTSRPTPPTVAVRGFLDALGVAPQRIPDNLDAQVGLYRSLLAGRRMLIVLDNARDATQVIPLLPGSPTCTVLVTSRDRLAALVTAHGAQPLALSTLDQPAAHALLTRYLGQQRLADEPEAVAELLTCCAGLPLALGIVAARALMSPALPLATWTLGLRDTGTRLAEFDDGDSATDLNTVLSWSYAALTPQQAEVFGLLGLAPGPDISLSAAARLTGLSAGQAKSVLHSLQQASLLQRPEPGRYRMHDLVRLYAIDRARRDQPRCRQREALRRMVDFYLHTAHTCQRLINPHRPLNDIELPTPQPTAGGPDDRTTAWTWLKIEHPGLLAAQQLAADQGWYAIVWKLALLLDTFHRRRALLRDNLTAWETGLAAATRSADPGAQILCHRLLGAAHSRAGQHADAFGHLHHALALATDVDDRRGEAHTHQALAWAYNRAGDTSQALAHATRALDLYQHLGNHIGEGEARHTIGWLHALLDHYRPALAYCQTALALHRQHHDPDGEAATLISLGYLAEHTDQHSQALDYYRQSLTLLRDLGHVYNEAEILERLGHAHAALGQHRQAGAHWQQALHLYHAQHRRTDADRIRTQLDGRAATNDDQPPIRRPARERTCRDMDSK